MTHSPFSPFHSTGISSRRPDAFAHRAGRLARWVLLGAALAVGSVHPLLAQAPVNDALAGAVPLTGSTNIVTGSNTAATSEAGEPSHADIPAMASVWWTWVAPDDGPVVVDTLGSAFDTVLAVYTGDVVNALALVAANDDAPGLPTSRVIFPALRGTPYHIAVDGFLGANGDVQLRIHLPVAPSAPVIISQPASRTVPDNAGSNVTFSVAAAGSFPMVFDWRKGVASLPGGTNASFMVPNATLASAGDYWVVISNAYGSATSSVAQLTVLEGLGQDLFADRVAITGQTNAVTGHNYGAALEAGEPIHAGVTNGASLWWTWTAPQNGLALLDTAGSTDALGEVLDTVLAVYVGTDVASLAPVAANDDEVHGLIKSSRLFFRAAAGTTYQIAVAGVPHANGVVAMGDIRLNLAQAPDNDFFTNALVFPLGMTTVQDDNRGATVEAGEPPHAGNIGGNSVWWAWVAPSNGTYEVDTLGSSIDTVLGVYTGTSVNALTLISENDNRAHASASLVKFFALGGATYYFVVDGSSGNNGVAAGHILLNLDPALALNDDFADRVTLAGQTNRVTASNIGASKEPGEPGHGANPGGRSVWWTWTAPFTGPAIVTTRKTLFDTTLAVYAGNQLAALTLIGESDDDDPDHPLQGASVLLQATAGQTYQIAVDGYQSGDGTVAQGTIELGLFQVTPTSLGGNDLFANRFPITGQTNIVIGSSTNATKEVGEPFHSSNRGGRSIWWSWVAPASGPVLLNTAGTEFESPLLAVYVGTNVDQLTEVTSATPSYGQGSASVMFSAVQGVEYQFAVDGYNNGVDAAAAAAGRVGLSLLQFPPQPLHANDSFENATPISAPYLTVQSANIGADREPGEPAHMGLQQGHSIWWTWTAQTDGVVTMSTTNSEYDTILSVYTGADLASLSLVAENDDINAGHVRSSVTFQAVAGTVYRIAVDGYGGRVGFIVLTVSPWTASPTAPQILQAPADQTRFLGGGGGGASPQFRVGAIGAPPLSYQWSFNGTNLAQATNTTLTVTNATAADAGIYQVTVGNALGVVASSGARLTLLEVPFNDAFTNRILLTGTSNVVLGSVLEARVDTNGVDVADGRSVVWWQWTAPAAGPVEIHTIGTPHDTLLAVYTGDAVNSLLSTAANDDCFYSEAGSGPSRVVFDAIAGENYQIAIRSFKSNYTASGLMLTVMQPPQPLRILDHPRSPAGLSVTNAAFTLEVSAVGLTPVLNYQWRFNGNPIPGATNASHTFAPLSRTNSGLYSVTIANDFGSVTSSNASVWVQVPQWLQAPQRQPDGRVLLSFSDPDGALSSEPSRFEVHHTLNLSGPTTVWVTNAGGITTHNGRFLFEDQTSGAVSRRIYRVIER